ncbi:NAD(P)-dependent alcohol dehydrogenase [Devosia sp. CN2-171]|uniref:NAD(P)-dependent alcohol dehydrogenase n=1 Tax=Devosia sp. CN2-171 TaxID=3400909 RepID=UPI003BF7D4BF
MMRALVYERYGPPEALRLEQVPRPQPGPGEVLVRVRAASVNSRDWDLLTGTLMGRIGSPFRPPHKILGADIAGTIEAVGQGVSQFSPGDAVFGDLSGGSWGGFADYVSAVAAALAPVPSGLDFVKAAALPQAGALALQGLRCRPSLGAGDAVLLNGAGGGVGTVALQIAKGLGATVTAVDRSEKRERLLALGADAFIDYREADFITDPDRYDLILDVVARHSPNAFSRCLRDRGNLVVIGGTLSSILGVAALGPLVGRKRDQRLELLIHRPSTADFTDLAERCLAGTLTPVIDSVYPLADGAEALRRLGSGLAFGKVIITPDG